MRVKWIVVLAAVAVALPAGNLSAEPETPDCGLCQDSGSGGGGITGPGGGPAQHRFGPTVLSCVANGNGEICRDCDAFNACHTDWQNNTCVYFHWACGQTQAASDAVKFVDPLDPRGVEAVLAANPVHLTLVGGKYLAVLDCDGHVIEARRVGISAGRPVPPSA
jgi:hypothetical protein